MFVPVLAGSSSRLSIGSRISLDRSQIRIAQTNRGRGCEKLQKVNVFYRNQVTEPAGNRYQRWALPVLSTITSNISTPTFHKNVAASMITSSTTTIARHPELLSSHPPWPIMTPYFHLTSFPQRPALRSVPVLMSGDIMWGPASTTISASACPPGRDLHSAPLTPAAAAGGPTNKRTRDQSPLSHR